VRGETFARLRETFAEPVATFANVREPFASLAGSSAPLAGSPAGRSLCSVQDGERCAGPGERLPKRCGCPVKAPSYCTNVAERSAKSSSCAIAVRECTTKSTKSTGGLLRNAEDLVDRDGPPRQRRLGMGEAAAAEDLRHVRLSGAVGADLPAAEDIHVPDDQRVRGRSAERFPAERIHKQEATVLYRAACVAE
jgi:hypothetical protein